MIEKKAVASLRLLLAINRDDSSFLKHLLAINRNDSIFLRLMLAINRNDCSYFCQTPYSILQLQAYDCNPVQNQRRLQNLTHWEITKIFLYNFLIKNTSWLFLERGYCLRANGGLYCIFSKVYYHFTYSNCK